MTEINKLAVPIECGYPWCAYHYRSGAWPVHYADEALGRQHHEGDIARGFATREQAPTVKVGPWEIVAFAGIEVSR
jgi:hypothetical protein